MIPLTRRDRTGLGHPPRKATTERHRALFIIALDPQPFIEISSATMPAHDESSAHHAAAPPFSAKALGRLQVFHPISLLLLIASFAVCSVVIHPTLGQVGRNHPTFFNPNDTWLLGYWGLLLLLQVGTTLSYALASGEKTKALLTNGISLSLPVANLSLAIWAPVFIADTHASHIAGEVFLGIATVLLLWSTLVTGLKQAYHPTWRRPVEWLLIHLPVRLLLAVLLHADIWQQGLIAFGLAQTPHDLKKTVWPSFIVIISTGVAAALWVFATTDVAFGLAGIYIQLAILFHPKITISEHRPSELLAASILSISLQAIALFASLTWNRLRTRQEGRIALPINADDDEAVNQAEYEARIAEERARKRRSEAERVRDDARSEGQGSGSRSTSRAASISRDGQSEAEAEVTPSQLERGEGGHGDHVEVTRKLGSGGR